MRHDAITFRAVGRFTAQPNSRDWLVLSDRVYSPNLGGHGGGEFAREAVLVPDGGDPLVGETVMF
jgi:hypothetical protein